MAGPRADRLNVKLFRDPAGDHGNYGPEVERALAAFVADARAFATLGTRSRVRLAKTRIVVERHEDGPAVLGIPLAEIATYASTLATMIRRIGQICARR